MLFTGTSCPIFLSFCKMFLPLPSW
uniref:Uncharacterized protein n=1 Tax=Rhizophora mucronata TaxID=61149 RepID=A0A2P2PDL8_RHIMU